MGKLARFHGDDCVSDRLVTLLSAQGPDLSWATGYVHRQCSIRRKPRVLGRFSFVHRADDFDLNPNDAQYESVLGFGGRAWLILQGRGCWDAARAVASAAPPVRSRNAGRCALTA